MHIRAPNVLALLRGSVHGAIYPTSACFLATKVPRRSIGALSQQQLHPHWRASPHLANQYTFLVRYLWGGRNVPSSSYARSLAPEDEESARDEIISIAFKSRQPAALLMRCEYYGQINHSEHR
jgi:hypothetical protein